MYQGYLARCGVSERRVDGTLVHRHSRSGNRAVPYGRPTLRQSRDEVPTGFCLAFVRGRGLEIHALALISSSARTSLSRSAIDVYTCGVTRTHLMFSHTMPTVWIL